MAGPVFVVDAQGRPLMPLAPAHARKLLQSGKARRWPHPTLTIIQLSRTVEQPTLHPILLGVAIHRTVAELFVLAAGPQTTYPLLSIVVNLPHRRARFRGTTRRQPRRRHPLWRHLLVVGSVISYLWWLLPLSHIVLLCTPTIQTADRLSRRRLLQFLMVDELQVTIASPLGTAPPAFPPELVTLLQAAAANPAAHMPIMAASVILRQHQARLKRWRDDVAVDDKLSDIGVVTKPPLIGITDCDSTEKERVLEVPVAAGPAGVAWRYVALAPDTPLRRWPLKSVALLPLISRAVQDTVTLREDPLEAFVLSFYPEDDADASTGHRSAHDDG